LSSCGSKVALAGYGFIMITAFASTETAIEALQTRGVRLHHQAI
jgi:hypothetical protein